MMRAKSSNAMKMSKAAEMLRAWELSPLDLILYQKLGEGGQATVFRGKWKGFDVAIKQARMKFQAQGGRKAEQEQARGGSRSSEGPQAAAAAAAAAAAEAGAHRRRRA